jgi:hypothetical protein
MCQILSTKQTNKDETKGMNNKNEKKIKDPKTERKINTCHWGLLDTTLCDKVCQWLGRAFSSTNKTDRHDKTEILLKVALNTITLDPYVFFIMMNNKNEKKNKDPKTERKINTCHCTYQYKPIVQKPDREYIPLTLWVRIPLNARCTW